MDYIQRNSLSLSLSLSKSCCEQWCPSGHRNRSLSFHTVHESIALLTYFIHQFSLNSSETTCKFIQKLLCPSLSIISKLKSMQFTLLDLNLENLISKRVIMILELKPNNVLPLFSEAFFYLAAQNISLVPMFHISDHFSNTRSRSMLAFLIIIYHLNPFNGHTPSDLKAARNYIVYSLSLTQLKLQSLKHRRDAASLMTYSCILPNHLTACNFQLHHTATPEYTTSDSIFH